MDAQDRPGWNPPEASVLEPTAPTSADTHTSGPRRSRIGRGVAMAAIGIGALGIAGTAYASSSPSPSPSADGRHATGATGDYGARPGIPGGGMRPDGDGGHMRGGPGMGAGLAIHGTFVTPKQGGGYQTVDNQRGAVTSVSSTSITVKSVDGFTQSYAVTSTTMVNAQRDGISAIKVGDEVGVTAIESGSTRTAAQIVDRTQLGDMRGRLGPQPGGSASPAPTKTG